jgi:hypothetical protein
MEVQTFECEETAAETPEIAEEARALIEKLDLDGQRELSKPKNETPGNARNPFRKMTAEEVFVYGQICPQKTSLREFKEEPIPVRVLQVAAYAKELDVFKELVIWHRTSPAVLDPVLVGMMVNPKRSWLDGDPFILARWGEVLEEFPALVKSALELWRAAVSEKLATAKSEIDSALAGLDSMGIATAIAKGMPAYGF